MQTVAGERAMVDPALLDDPRLTMALPPEVIAYLRSADGVKAPQCVTGRLSEGLPTTRFRAFA